MKGLAVTIALAAIGVAVRARKDYDFTEVGKLSDEDARRFNLGRYKLET